ncbi:MULTISPECIES: NUDIX domain-containing protein [Methylomonas]|uniref:NUDIX hydrolase n=1 Tax=Methylomonas TaxID=416 RepID=UPI0007C8AC9C|nr:MULTISPECIES: NUDIX domain-containing protein [Methylomonas]ANE55809.1 NUDIX hydrolase [Methylomonas sp. DH-1]WNB77716.1 NUDIX domain-containing protein [Methylomonas koyamae]
MPNELLDVVDELDCTVDRRPRREIHASGLRHRAVHILVFNNHGELFLQKRSMLKDLNRGLWDSSAAGHVDAGETYGDCAPRELKEELGVAAADLKALFKLQACPQLGMEFIQVYRAEHNGPFELAADEIDEGDWFRPAAIDDRVARDDPTMTETFKIIWRHYRQHVPPAEV